MPEKDVLEPAVIDTIERYFDLLQAHAPLQQMYAEILTEDFETGFRGGFMWRGESGTQEFLDARSEFFDESHEITQIIHAALDADGILLARTRLSFLLRRREPGSARSEELTGDAFHLWRFRREPDGVRWRVAAQIVEGFARLNEGARTLFSAPTEGLRT
ncbi:hypothetical protein GCM10010193_28560 [Kitasatospora atroaurantiaca]|uniref:SnoaL-like protein n=1 Tax=Kitasatospora atroaurantiaca TaxID=285545 RepID=A0A561EIZ6_9ACTN|nr:hypothetical protein [Kitasatospora atroaurantiaca]TWE15587.1 hypothetical protein FB465_0491 [Kitasatospora atroaurantiaca]